jgi:hypothetical protein
LQRRLGAPLKRGHVVSHDLLLRIVTDHRDLLHALDERWQGGTTTGELLTAAWALFNTDPTLTSWSNATKIYQKVASRNKATGSRSKLYDVRGHFLPVAHLWAAWVLRKGRFVTQPDVEYDGWADFQSFLAEAEVLRDWGQTWRPVREKSSPLLPPDVWRVPDGWALPAQQPGWPMMGRIPLVTLSHDLLTVCRPPGRPRKIL